MLAPLRIQVLLPSPAAEIKFCRLFLYNKIKCKCENTSASVYQLAVLMSTQSMIYILQEKKNILLFKYVYATNVKNAMTSTEFINDECLYDYTKKNFFDINRK